MTTHTRINLPQEIVINSANLTITINGQQIPISEDWNVTGDPSPTLQCEIHAEHIRIDGTAATTR